MKIYYRYQKQLKIIFNFLETALPENIDEITLLKNKKYSLNFNTIGYSKKNKSVENLDKVVKSTSEYFSYQKDLIYDNEFKLINLLCKEGLIYYNYNNKFNTTNKLNLFFDWLAPMKWEFKHLISGIFLRRNESILFLYPEVYQNLIKSVYYFFYRRIKLIFWHQLVKKSIYICGKFIDEQYLWILPIICSFAKEKNKNLYLKKKLTIKLNNIKVYQSYKNLKFQY